MFVKLNLLVQSLIGLIASKIVLVSAIFFILIIPDGIFTELSDGVYVLAMGIKKVHDDKSIKLPFSS